MVGFLSPFAYLDNFGVGLQQPSIVAGSISNATFASASSAAQTYFTGYTAGAGSNRKVIVFFALEDTEASTISEACTWGGVAGRSIHYLRRDSTTDAQIIGYEWDEGFFPASATGDIIMDATNNEALSATVFTVQDACQGPFLDFITGVGADTSPATLDLTTSFNNSLLLTALVIGEEITDVAATGTGHTIVDNYDSNQGERVVIGKVDAGTAGAHTLGYTFTNSFHVAVSFAIAPVGAYTPITIHPAVSTGFGTAATAHAVAMPATVAAGDLLLVFLEFFWLATNPAGAITTPAGWSLIKAVDSVNGTNSRTLAMYAIEAVGNEDGTTVDFVTASNATAAAICLRIDAANWSSTLADIEAGTAANATNTSGPNPPSITPSWGPERALAIEVIGAVDDDVPMRLPSNGISGSTYFGKATKASGAGANAGASISIAYRMFTAASEDPGAVFLDTQDDCTSQTVVIRKAA